MTRSCGNKKCIPFVVTEILPYKDNVVSLKTYSIIHEKVKPKRNKTGKTNTREQYGCTLHSLTDIFLNN